MISRRTFLRTGLGATLLPVSQQLSAATPPADIAAIPAIDTHIHLYDPTRPEGVPWPPKSDALLYAPHRPEMFRAATAGLNVLGAIVVEASDWLEDNTWLLDLASKHDDLVGVVGNFKLGQPGFAAQLARPAANPRFRGVRLKAGDLKSADDSIFRANLRRLVDAGLAVDVLGGPAVLPDVASMAKRAPDMRIIVNHLPFREWDGDPNALTSALRPLASTSNVFLKVSDVIRRREGRVIDDPAFYQPAFDALLALFGDERLIFASNWPVSNRSAPYAVQHSVLLNAFLAHGRATAERFFWRNSVAAYRWVPTPRTAPLRA